MNNPNEINVPAGRIQQHMFMASLRVAIVCSALNVDPEQDPQSVAAFFAICGDPDRQPSSIETMLGLELSLFSMDDLRLVTINDTEIPDERVFVARWLVYSICWANEFTCRLQFGEWVQENEFTKWLDRAVEYYDKLPELVRTEEGAAAIRVIQRVAGNETQDRLDEIRKAFADKHEYEKAHHVPHPGHGLPVH